MTLKECYAALEGDYENVISRLRLESMVQKFVLKFLDDPSYQLLCDSMGSKNREEAFRAAHTIKGVCQNLSLTKLGNSSDALCEALRNEWKPEADGLFLQVKNDYKQTIDAIEAFKQTLE